MVDVLRFVWIKRAALFCDAGANVVELLQDGSRKGHLSRAGLHSSTCPNIIRGG
jgi:hypothetical protein